jgi:hypothetical protein
MVIIKSLLRSDCLSAPPFPPYLWTLTTYHENHLFRKFDSAYRIGLRDEIPPKTGDDLEAVHLIISIQ